MRPDKRSNSAEMNKLLDRAITMLEVSSVSEIRDQVKENLRQVRDNHNAIAEYRRKRLAAPTEASLSRIKRVNPFTVTKESIDESIAELQEEIQELGSGHANLKYNFRQKLAAIGIEIDEDGIDSLLNSISGEDFVNMAVAFDNIKLLTQQLQQLSEQSGEALDTARRYYGMYVVMVQAMDRMQKTFVDRAENVHIPKLVEFASQAENNIEEARGLIESGQGTREVLLNNIEANQVTRRAAEVYMDYLRQQASDVANENRASEKTLNTAMNTYMTVKLSSDVASLIESGRSEFDSLMKLSLPAMKGFENEEIRKELKRITQELSDG